MAAHLALQTDDNPEPALAAGVLTTAAAERVFGRASSASSWSPAGGSVLAEA